MRTGLGGIVLFAGILPLLLGLLMAAYQDSRKVYRGFGFWVWANFSLGAGFLLIGLRTQIPDLVSIIVGNALGVYGIILMFEGTELFFGRRSFDLINHLIFGIYLVLQTLFTYLIPSTNARVVLSSATLVAVQARVAYALLAHAPERLRRMTRTMALVFILSCLLLLARGIYALYQTGPIDMLTDLTLVAVALSTACAVTIWTFYFFFLNSARVEFDLENASDQLAQAVDTSRREVAQLALLEEAGQLVSGSLDESEILQRAVEAVVNRFGYAEAGASMLVEGDKLELQAVSGTEDTGFRRGYRQGIGEGIIGHVGETGQVYVSGDIEQDPYYYTIGHRSGSAAGVPLLNEGQLMGVLYVESTAKDAFKQSDIQTLRALVSHMVTAVNKARLYASSQDHLVMMTTLHTVSQIITSTLELDHIFQTVLQLLKDTYGYTHLSIYLLEKDLLHLRAQIGYSDDSVLREIPITEGVIGRTVRTQEMQFVRDAGREPAFLRAARSVNSEICVPLFGKGNVLGVINVEGSRQNPLLDRDVDVLTALAGPIGIAIENANLHAQAKALARIDGLTGLMNRRTFDETLEAEMARAIRYECPLTLIVLDIDDFKACNDQWGHPAGDVLLRATANLIRGNTRSSDSSARYGGDEFTVILPNTTLADGYELGERLRAAAPTMVAEPGEDNVPPGIYTFSVGVAAFPENGRTAEELLLSADHAELMAKKLGKNRVCTARVQA